MDYSKQNNKKDESLLDKIANLQNELEIYKKMCINLRIQNKLLKEESYSLLEDLINLQNKKEENYLDQLDILRDDNNQYRGSVHDINNIFAIIIGYSQLAMSDENKELFNQIINATKHASKLTDAMLKLSKYNYDQEEFCDPVKITKDIVSYMSFKYKRISTSLTYDKKIGNIKISPCLFYNSLINLCINAEQAIIENGKISINMQDIPNYIKISISDNGMGMNENTIKNIFEPKFTTKENGNGMGLANVKKYINKLGGIIACYSKKENGTTFIVYFPKSE